MEFVSNVFSCQVFSRVNKVLVPAIQILQERTNNAAPLPNNNNRDAGLLETVRGRWCALLETQMPTEKYDYWSRIFNTVVADDNSGFFLLCFFFIFGCTFHGLMSRCPPVNDIHGVL